MPQTPQDPAAFDLRDTVRRWLEGYPLAVHEQAPLPGTVWTLRGTGDAGDYAVGLFSENPDEIMISAVIDVPPAVSAHVDESLLADLRMGLLAFDVFSGGLARPLRRLSFSARMYWSGANQEQFVRALHRVRNALLFVQAFVNKAVPGSADPSGAN